MSEKLISLAQLQEYKTHADAKYQNKFTAGNNITISNNLISANDVPVRSGTIVSGWPNVPTDGTVTKVGEIKLQPGLYFIEYAVVFQGNTTGTRQCAISTDTTLTGYGYAYMDSRLPPSGSNTMTVVVAIINVSASEYPNGRTFNFLVAQNSGASLWVAPRAYYIKF